MLFRSGGLDALALLQPLRELDEGPPLLRVRVELLSEVSEGLRVVVGDRQGGRHGAGSRGARPKPQVRLELHGTHDELHTAAGAGPFFDEREAVALPAHHPAPDRRAVEVREVLGADLGDREEGVGGHRNEGWGGSLSAARQGGSAGRGANLQPRGYGSSVAGVKRGWMRGHWEIGRAHV